MLGVHFGRYKTFILFSFGQILFSTIAKKKKKKRIRSSNHMHLFTSMILNYYNKPQIKKEYKKGKGKWEHGQETSCKIICCINVHPKFGE